jgi:phosphoglycerate dehydrogenase-like enzyme
LALAERPLILVDPLPRTLDIICEPEVRRRLEALGKLVVSEDRQTPDAEVDRLLPETTILIGQTAVSKERLARAPKLKAIFNVEGNFLPNVDYRECQVRGVWVLSPTSSFAQVVAESSVAMAIDLARGITAADRAFRAGTERYGLDANEGCFMFSGAPVGIIGFGDLGRATRALLAPLRNPIKVYDPWIPDDVIRNADCTPAALDEVLGSSRIVFVFASVTTENQGFIGKREFALMQPGTCFLLMSRAAVVDFPEFLNQVRSGRIRAATDVFPTEPVAKDDPVRSMDNLLLSAHRTGGMREALYQIGRMTVADAELILNGLAPVMCRRADPAIAARLRSMPVKAT